MDKKELQQIVNPIYTTAKGTVMLLAGMGDKEAIALIPYIGMDEKSVNQKVPEEIQKCFMIAQRARFESHNRAALESGSPNMYERVKDGYWIGGAAVPFGYDYDPAQNVLIPNEHAADVKEIFQLYLDGYSTTQLAKMFPVCNDHHVTLILDRITYTGKITYKGEIFEGRHEAIIDNETFEKARKQRQKRSTKSVPRNDYLFTSMLYCGKCGAKMRYQKWGKRVKIYCYSQVKSRPEFVKDPDCDNMRYEAGDIESAVLDDLFKVTDSIKSHETKDYTMDSRTQRLGLLRHRKSETITKIKKLYDLYASNGDEILLDTIQECQQQLESVSRVLDDEVSSYAKLNIVERGRRPITNLRELWDQLSPKEQQRAVRICIDKIVINDKKVTVKYLV